MNKIGIAITVHNRHETAKVTIANIRKFAPKEAKVVIVDDASEIPFKDADFRFDKQAGIARAKNKCIELLEVCEHLFLFDDDCYPKVKDWHLPYINSQYNHLMYIFGNFSNGRPNGNRKQKEIEDAVIFENPCGCMIYYKRICIDTVGGMDAAYGVWGFEHPDHSTRIYNAGLTPFKFMDIKGGDELFYSYDKEQTIKRSVPPEVRAKHIATNQIKYMRLGKSTKYIPYKKENNLILTTYFTTLIDPQRGAKWRYEPRAMNDLKASIPNGVDFHCITDHEGKYKPKHANPYLAKWVAFRDYISSANYDNIFMVDATDVQVLINPFDHIERGKLYVGCERSTILNEWLKKHHSSPFFTDFYRIYRSSSLLNAGICGGDRKTVLEFLDNLISYIDTVDCGMTDMAIFNYTLYSQFSNIIVYGNQVNTVFKAFDKSNRTKSWFRHK